MAENAAKIRNWPFIIGVLCICVGMQFANYGFRFTQEEIDAVKNN